jgi:hypothetical protein
MAAAIEDEFVIPLTVEEQRRFDRGWAAKEAGTE